MLVLLIFVAIAFALELFIGKQYLNWIAKKEFVQPLLDIGPDHAQKQGTPTMGGISFIITIAIMAFVIMLLPTSPDQVNNLPIIIIVLVAYAYIGFKDDILKVTKKDNGEGLSPKQKLVAQFFVGALVTGYLLMSGFEPHLELYSINYVVDLNGILGTLVYSAVVIFLFMAVSNATNLTDGLDGLLATTYIFSYFPLAIISFMNDDRVLMLVVAVIAALLGFLVYNFNPAKMFMGDTGSLALGGMLVVTCVILHVELLIFFFGFVFLLETISVIAQVSFFKYTRKKYGEGRRLFKMAPFHHHLEKEGFNEKKIVMILATVQFVASIIGLLIYFG